MSSLLPLFATTALGLADNFANRSAAKKQNERSEMYQTLMYNRQRSDALSDWNMQNAYNDPAAQMQRLKNAGLNPHLMYGQGTVGNSSTGVRSSDMPSPQYNVPKSNLGNVLQNALMIKQLQSNIARTDAETKAIESRTVGTEFQNQVNQTIGAQRVADKYNWATDMLRNQHDRQLADWNAYVAAGFQGKETTDPTSMVAKAIRAGMQRTIQEASNAKTRGDIYGYEAAIKKFEKELTDQGISPNSPYFIKMLGDLYRATGINKFFDDLPATYQELTK